ncbi:OPT/YSL family transporter [Eggerthella sinensis]|uniref:OPT/YSL family transporter n=1 Tax=Eggerthella sinensis TaxID=242230 RepID=UPI0022E79B5E|nr:OPT/YSL family transporter [Eggerthella sinensis]
MEIFGLIVLLAVAAVSSLPQVQLFFGLIVLLAVAAVSSLPQVQLFFVAGIVAVACGLAGDVMNDFHAGHVLGTSPKAQWIGQAIGAVIGAVARARKRSGSARPSAPSSARWWPWRSWPSS